MQSCAEVLCATGEADVTLRDRWNSTPIDIATGDTKDVLMNKGKEKSRQLELCLFVHIRSASIDDHSQKWLSNFSFSATVV